MQKKLINGAARPDALRALGKARIARTWEQYYQDRGYELWGFSPSPTARILAQAILDSNPRRSERIEVVDWGCGYGRDSLYFLELGFDVIGIDVSKKAVALALPHRREVLADGRLIELGGRAYDLLIALIEANGAVVGRDELISRVWPGRVVEEGNLRAQISALRSALGEPDLIRTVAGRGYQFTGVVRGSGRRGQAPTSRGGTDAAVTAAPRLSIVVLPFLSLSDDREQQYFADGITEDLTTYLSRLSGYSIISRNTAFTYRNSPPTQSRSVASWECVTCSKGVSSGRATASASALS